MRIQNRPSQRRGRGPMKFPSFSSEISPSSGESCWLEEDELETNVCTPFDNPSALAGEKISKHAEVLDQEARSILEEIQALQRRMQALKGKTKKKPRKVMAGHKKSPPKPENNGNKSLKNLRGVTVFDPIKQHSNSKRFHSSQAAPLDFERISKATGKNDEAQITTPVSRVTFAEQSTMRTFEPDEESKNEETIFEFYFSPWIKAIQGSDSNPTPKIPSEGENKLSTDLAVSREDTVIPTKMEDNFRPLATRRNWRRFVKPSMKGLSTDNESDVLSTDQAREPDLNMVRSDSSIGLINEPRDGVAGAMSRAFCALPS